MRKQGASGLLQGRLLQGLLVALLATALVGLGAAYMSGGSGGGSNSVPPEGNDQEQEVELVQVRALFHSLAGSFPGLHPEELRVMVDVPVRIFNTSVAFDHPPSNAQEGIKIIGTGGEVCVEFEAHPDKVTVVEFVPRWPGTLTITHSPHGHTNLNGHLIVEQPDGHSTADGTPLCEEVQITDLG